MQLITSIVLFIFLSFASIGWSATYYIDYNAADDSANGTAKETPWKRHPYMVGWAGSYSHSTGDQFIFKGGVTWPAAALPLTVAANGSVGNNDYYGVDVTWYDGGSWSRPIFDYNWGTSDAGVIITNYRSYLTIDNLEVKNINSTANNYSYALIRGYESHHITIQNCYLHGWIRIPG